MAIKESIDVIATLRVGIGSIRRDRRRIRSKDTKKFVDVEPGSTDKEIRTRHHSWSSSRLSESLLAPNRRLILNFQPLNSSRSISSTKATPTLPRDLVLLTHEPSSHLDQQRTTFVHHTIFRPISDISSASLIRPIRLKHLCNSHLYTNQNEVNKHRLGLCGHCIFHLRRHNNIRL